VLFAENGCYLRKESYLLHGIIKRNRYEKHEQEESYSIRLLALGFRLRGTGKVGWCVYGQYGFSA
jgi:hypothetical protein